MNIYQVLWIHLSSVFHIFQHYSCAFIIWESRDKNNSPALCRKCLPNTSWILYINILTLKGYIMVIEYKVWINLFINLNKNSCPKCTFIISSRRSLQPPSTQQLHSNPLNRYWYSLCIDGWTHWSGRLSAIHLMESKGSTLQKWPHDYTNNI